MTTLPRVLAASALALLLSPASYGADMARLAKDCSAPDYLQSWVRGDMRGSVTIAYSVDASGRIINPKVLQSSGYRRLDEASLKAVKACKAASPRGAADAPLSGLVRYDWQIE